MLATCRSVREGEGAGCHKEVQEAVVVEQEEEVEERLVEVRSIDNVQLHGVVRLFCTASAWYWESLRARHGSRMQIRQGRYTW